MTDAYPVASFVDVPLVAGGALVVAMAIIGGAVHGPIRLVVGVPLLFFAPGYGLLSALFPESRPGGRDGHGPLGAIPRGRGLGWNERMALSVPTSVALLPPLGVAFALVGVPFTAVTIAESVAAVTVLCVAVGVFRRVQLPPERRLAVPIGRWIDDLRGAVVGSAPLDAALNVLLIVAVVSALAGLAFGLAAPDSGETYTEAALLSDDGESLVAGNYTTDTTAGDPVRTTVTVENHEGEDRTYTLVAVVERVQNTGSGSSVVERSELTREQRQVSDGSTWEASTTVRPQMLGDDLRLSYYLYDGEAPDTVTGEQADRHLYIWISVDAPAGTGGTANATAVRGEAV